MKILRSPGLYSEAELQALNWLGYRAKWLEVRVRRRSEREFDLGIEGVYDGDDGYDYPPATPIESGIEGVQAFKINRVLRGYPKVRRNSFSAWFPLAALGEFWAMGLHSPLHGDWSFTRDMEAHAIWGEFHRIVELGRSKPLFSQNFMRCLNQVWQSFEGEGEFADNGDAIEACLDAGRLTMLGTGAGKQAEEELKWFDDFFGPQRVVAELEKLVAFVA